MAAVSDEYLGPIVSAALRVRLDGYHVRRDLSNRGDQVRVFVQLSLDR